jgi:hypothetical protein
MTLWPVISCQRGHTEHPTTLRTIVLGGKTPYEDYAPIPFRMKFDMEVFEPEPHDDHSYCPAADAVSETIKELGVWEVPETIVLVDLFRRNPKHIFIDMGAHIGWFSMLALQCGLDAMSIEADPVTYSVLSRNTDRAVKFGGNSFRVLERITGPCPALAAMAHNINDGQWTGAIVKIDIEGAEPEAILALWPLLKLHQIDHILMEVSPAFHDGYPELVADLMRQGFVMRRLPHKQIPPQPLETVHHLGIEDDPDNAADWVREVFQENILLSRVRAVDGSVAADYEGMGHS